MHGKVNYRKDIDRMNTLFENNLQPGELILTSIGSYEHTSIVSDRRCALGKPMLISATARTGTVMEEQYATVVRGRKTGYAPQQSNLPSHIVLKNARSQIGKWKYGVLGQNCENFANWAGGLKVTSRQVNGVLSGAAISVCATKLIVKDPSPLAYLFAALLGGAVGLASAQILE